MTDRCRSVGADVTTRTVMASRATCVLASRAVTSQLRRRVHASVSHVGGVAMVVLVVVVMVVVVMVVMVAGVWLVMIAVVVTTITPVLVRGPSDRFPSPVHGSRLPAPLPRP